MHLWRYFMIRALKYHAIRTDDDKFKIVHVTKPLIAYNDLSLNYIFQNDLRTILLYLRKHICTVNNEL